MSGRRPLPLIFDWLAVFLAVQAHLFALILIFGSLPAYSSPARALALWGVSLAIPLGCVAAARRAGGDLSDRRFVLAGSGLVLIEVGQLLVLPLPDLGSPPAFIWGTTGVSVLICAAFRPMRDILVLASAVTLPPLVLLVPRLGSADGEAFRLLATLSATTLPALAAAQYLSQYVLALRSREEILAQSLAVESRVRAARLVRQDSERRLDSVRAELVPLLASVASGEVAIGDPAVGRQARRLGDALRRELVETRTGRWLLDSPVHLLSEDAARPGFDGSGDDWPGVVLLDPQSLLGQLADPDRAAISVLLGVLRVHPHWRRVSVALASEHSIGLDEQVAVTVVADGPAVGRASRDPRVLVAAGHLRAELNAEAPDVLVADAVITVGR